MSLPINITAAIQKWADEKSKEIITNIYANDQISDLDDVTIDWDILDENDYEEILQTMETNLIDSMRSNFRTWL
jgi:hypothetical protein